DSLRPDCTWIVHPHLLPAPLLLKLRRHFAEFLLRKSLEHLRLLASPTCVGLRHGHARISNARLISAVGSYIPFRWLAPPSASSLDYPNGFAYPETSTALHRHNHPPTDDSLLRPPSFSNDPGVVREY